MGIQSVLVDQREPSWAQELKFGGAPVMSMLLDTGDFVVTLDNGDVLGIERKTCSDFLNTLRDERLFPQLAKLRDLTQWAYLALVGNIQPGPAGTCVVDGRASGWNWASVTGALLSVQECGVHVLYVASDEDLEASLLRLANRERRAMRVRPARDLTLVGDAETVLGSLPGVGPDRAKALLDYAGSVAWALTWLADDTMPESAVPGVGQGTKRRVRRALGLDDAQALAVVLKATGNPVVRVTQEEMELVG